MKDQSTQSRIHDLEACATRLRRLRQRSEIVGKRYESLEQGHKEFQKTEVIQSPEKR